MNALELKARREALGLSKDALAVTLDVRDKSVERWEYGKNPPRDWGWIDAALTWLEEYRERLVVGMMADAVELHEEAGVARLLTYADRRSFRRSLAEGGALELGEGVAVLPVELHRAAAAEAARRLRAGHGICVRLEDVARPDE